MYCLFLLEPAIKLILHSIISASIRFWRKNTAASFLEAQPSLRDFQSVAREELSLVFIYWDNFTSERYSESSPHLTSHNEEWLLTQTVLGENLVCLKSAHVLKQCPWGVPQLWNYSLPRQVCFPQRLFISLISATDFFPSRDALKERLWLQISRTGKANKSFKCRGINRREWGFLMWFGSIMKAS